MAYALKIPESDVPVPDEEYVSPEEYLRRERLAEYKSEYVDGKIIAMAGASYTHNRLVSRLNLRVGAIAEQNGCTSLASDMRVQIPNTPRYRYPDLTIVCDEPILEGEDVDVLLNPLLIIEVLSRSTQDADREDKFREYRQIPSLLEYVLVSQTAPSIEQYQRQEDSNLWLFVPNEGWNASITFTSLGVTIPLRDLYAGILNEP